MAEHMSLPLDSLSPDLGYRNNPHSSEPISTLYSRNPYRRELSLANANMETQGGANRDDDAPSDTAKTLRKPRPEGLGIAGRFGKGSPYSFTQSPPSSSHSEQTFLSPTMSSPGIPRVQLSRKDTKQSTRSVAWEVSEDQDSLHSSPYIPNPSSADQTLLEPSHLRHPSEPGLPHFECQTDGAIIGGRWTWISISILVLAVYSTVFSIIYLVIASWRPRYGKKIGTNGHMSVAGAAILSTTFAKTIELSFVTVVVAFLGQVLSRRAFLAKARGGGISIAEMMMRQWIMQPGTLITHGEAVKYAAMSFLGIISLIAALVAMLYVTAAESLVSPKLRLRPWEETVIYGKVTAAFANSTFLAQKCPTPISFEDDSLYRGSTCLQIEHAGQAYHNYQLYLDGWSNMVNSGNARSIDYAGRPPPIGVLFDNTTVRGQWINPSGENITADSTKRLVQNLTMAMPHANVFNAARDSANGIMQPEELSQGEGEYVIRASVPAPAVNILCAGVTEEDISSLIYVNWPTNNHTFNLSTWPHVDDMIREPAYPNATAIDDLFHFGPDAGDARQRAPIFPKLPIPYNTLVNGTGSWPAHSIYLLAGSPPNLKTSPYLFCSLKVMQYPGCTTEYRATKSGGNLTVHCDHDPQNILPYRNSRPDAPSGVWEPNWKNIGSEWANSLALGTGISDGDAANARLLTQLIPKYDNETHTAFLDPLLPSVGEALGELAGCTLLLSSMWSPYVHYWNYSTDSTIIEQPEYQAFNASLQYREYGSGPTEHWQNVFYIVLVIVVLTNIFCLGYLIWTIREGQVTDYTEPQNMFALAVNSPPSLSLSGACGAGPEGDMLSKKWEVDMQKTGGGGVGHPHFYVKCGEDEHHQMDAFGRLRHRRSKLSLRGMEDFEVAESPAVEQYTMLANRRKSFL